MRFSIYFNRKLCLIFFLNIHFLYWSLIEAITGLFSPPPQKKIKRKEIDVHPTFFFSKILNMV